MLTCESVRSTDSPHFAMLDALYARAFPWHEQRESEAKRQALSHPRYALEAWFDEGVFVGLSGCWQFAGYGYIEHLAIDDTLRSRGYGKQLLAQILTRAPLTILEIDPLVDDASVRRKGFYERCGYVANAFAHVHPPYQAANRGHELIVMSYPHAISQSEFDSFTLDLGEKVMKYSEGKRNA